jgi:RNA ligase (TIGR02306 family)
MFYVDAVIPKEFNDLPIFSFLSNSHMGKRVKTIKLRKEFSQGLFLPFQSVKDLYDKLTKDTPLNTDLTDVFRVVKYYESTELPLYKPLVGNENLAPFPVWIPKTDQPRIQENVKLASLFPSREIVATIKIDGQSATFYYNPEEKEAGMCSRNYRILNDVDSSQFRVVNTRYNILEKLTIQGRCLAVQGEIYGEKINGNRLKMSGIDFAVFDVYEKKTGESIGRYLPRQEMVELCELLDLPVVPRVDFPQKPVTVDEWVQAANNVTYDSVSKVKGLLAEGIVVKTCDGKTPYISCKVISRTYLEKHNL